MIFNAMVVDDSLTNRILLENMLGRLPNVSVTSFSCPVDALAWAQANEPDLIFVDYLMPRLEGPDFIRQLRRIPHCDSIPVVMVTGYEDRPALYKALEAGATDFLNKPPDEVEFLARVRNMLKLRAGRRELIRLATIDDLTGLANRRHFLKLLGEEIDVANATGQSLTLALIDADHFKTINDSFGHVSGDRVLEKLGRTISMIASDRAFAGRIGGEEIALALKGMPLEEGWVIAEEVRKTVENLELSSEDGAPVPVTVSIGLGSHRSGDDIRALLHRADLALYAAKDQGRNRVLAFPSDDA